MCIQYCTEISSLGSIQYSVLILYQLLDVDQEELELFSNTTCMGGE